jgi:hypothetical protein
MGIIKTTEGNMEEKGNKLETNSKNTHIKILYKDIYQFEKEHKSRINLTKTENSYVHFHNTG